MPVILEAENISKHFKGQAVLADISLSVQENEILTIIGESGCGKTTLLKILAGFISPDAGRVIFKGTDLSSCTRKEYRSIRRSIQLIFQSSAQALDPRMSAEKIIQEATEGSIVQYADAVRLDRSLLRRRPSELSGGEKQRVAIARALAAKPDILLADEPISAMDASAKAGMLNLFMDIRDEFGITMLLVEHDMKAAQCVSDRMLIMEHGRIEAI